MRSAKEGIPSSNQPERSIDEITSIQGYEEEQEQGQSQDGREREAR